MYTPPKTTSISISILVLMLVNLACLQTASPYVTDPAPTETAVLDEDGYSGTVYEIPTPAPSRKCARVTAAQSLYVREGQSEKTRVIFWLPANETVTILDDSADWWLVTRPGPVTLEPSQGYANSAYLERSECEPSQ